MYKHIGHKIKVLAQVIAWLGIIGSCILGIAAGLSLGYAADEAILGILLGILVAGLGSLFAWIGGFLLYGFGQLVDNSDKMAESISTDVEYPNIPFFPEEDRQ